MPVSFLEFFIVCCLEEIQMNNKYCFLLQYFTKKVRLPGLFKKIIVGFHVNFFIYIYILLSSQITLM